MTLLKSAALVHQGGVIMSRKKENVKSLEEEKEKFDKAKEDYEACRAAQRTIIMNYLEQNAGFTVTQRGGRGIPEYGIRKKTQGFSVGYDLTNWKYIDCEKEGERLLISLQTFDRNPGNNDYHVLMDRIGIYIYAQGSNKTSDAIERMLATNIDLPMDETKLQKLARLLNKIIDGEKEIEQMKRSSKIMADIENDEDLKGLVPVIAENTLLRQLFDI